MDKRKQISTLLWAVLCSSLTACSVFLEDTYSSVTPHTVAPVSEDSKIILVESYHELVNALTYYVTAMEATGQIRLNEYSKDAAKIDLTTAVQEVLKETALGSYGVDKIDWELSTIMGTVESEIQISYKKSTEELNAILPVNGTNAIVSVVSQSLADKSDSLVMQNSWSSSDRSQIPSIMQRAYQDSAQYLVELPQVHTTFYPKEGNWRILELEFHYTLSPETKEERLDALDSALSKLTSPLWSREEEDHFQALLQSLGEIATLSALGDTPYHVLVEGSGNYRGFSLAFLALCQEMALTCDLVEGTLLGEVHHWNMITLEDGNSYHVDVTKNAVDGVYPYYSDSDMKEQGYDWNQLSYPVGMEYSIVE